MLGRLSEKKVLIYFASGLTLHGVDNQAQLHATVDEAIRSGVSFWPIDARGLVAQAPLGDATQGSPGNAAMYSGTAALAVTTRLQQSQDTLFALAGDTGGKALLARMDDGRVADVLSRTDLVAHTEHTITSVPAYLRELGRVRERGYAIDEGELELGVRCVAVALDGGPAPAALSVSGPTTRMTDELVDRAAPRLLAAATELVADLTAANSPAAV